MQRSHRSPTSRFTGIAVAVHCSLLVACGVAIGDNAPNAEGDSLHEAHGANLAGNFRGMSAALRQVFFAESGDAVTEDNAAELLRRAFEVSDGRVAADWKLPPGLRRMSVEQIRRLEPEQLTFQVVVRGWSRTPELVTGLRLTRTDGREILAGNAGGPGWTGGPDGEGDWEFELEGDALQRPLADGPCRLFIEVEGDAWHEGWFYWQDLGASEAPQLRTPHAGQVFTDAHPTLRWDAFEPPEARSFEKRSLGVWIARIQPDQTPAWRHAWSTWRMPAVSTEVQVGREADGHGAERLEDGRYWVALTYGERRRFGDLTLVRSSRSARPFEVQTEHQERR